MFRSKRESLINKHLKYKPNTIGLFFTMCISHVVYIMSKSLSVLICYTQCKTNTTLLLRAQLLAEKMNQAFSFKCLFCIKYQQDKLTKRYETSDEKLTRLIRV